MTAPHPPRPRGWLAVLVAFSAIAALIVLSNGVALYETRRVHVSVDVIVRNAMTSVQLVQRMGGDIYRRRLLVDAHIFEKESVVMDRVERQIAAVGVDFAAAARAYEPLAIFPGEAGIWQRVKGDVAALDGPLAKVLALSRRDQDAAARAALVALDGRFAAIDADVASLVRINQQAAEEAVARVARLQRTATQLVVALALIGAILTLLIGLWTTRLVRQREDAVHRYAALLEARNRDLDAFAGRVAHDLRGPLTTISLASQTLGRTGAQEDRTLAILRRGVASMEALIQDLLELSRLDAHEPAGRSDPAAAAAHVQEDLAARLAAEAVTLRVDTAPASVRCGGGLLRQALANLVDNAAKYRRADVPAQIDLEGRLAGSRYELRVTDNGIGMTPAEAGQAFDPFYRALGVRDRPGTGLGLSIVKRVVEASGGEITVESRAGQGTTFVIRLPLAVDDGRPAP